MNGFLVVLVHTMDDLPIGLFATHPEAMALAKRQRGMPTVAMRNVFDTDASTPCCVSICEFRDGVPLGLELVKSF